MVRFLALLLVVRLASLPAQTPPAPVPAPAPGVPALVAEAEALLAANRNEDAARLLRSALAQLPGVAGEAVRATLRTTVQDLLKRADPHLDARRKGESEAAKLLVAAAEAYRKQGWARTALELLRQAEELDPDCARKPLEELRKAAPGIDAKTDELLARTPVAVAQPAAPPARREEFGTWFKTWRDVYGHAWQVRADGVESPRLTETTAMVVSGKETAGDYRALVDVQNGDRASTCALAFAVKGDDDYWLLSYDQYATGKPSCVRIYRYAGNEMKELALQAFVPTPAERSGWVTLEVTVQGREITAGVPGRAMAKATAPVDLAGKLGLFVSGNSSNKEPLKFRMLQVDKP